MQKNLALLNRFSDPTDIVHLALESDLAVSAATINASAAEKALLREKSRWIPDVSVNYNYQHSDVGFDNLTTPARTTSTLAVDFRYPIFEGGSRLARIRAASRMPVLGLAFVLRSLKLKSGLGQRGLISTRLEKDDFCKEGSDIFRRERDCSSKSCKGGHG